MDFEYLKKREYNFSLALENIEMLALSVVCFVVPFSLGHPQLLVGILVNSALILSAFNLRGYKLLPVIIIPSIAVITRGLIFGPYTPFLLYMMPLIWAGNAVLVVGIKKLYLDLKINKYASIAIAIILKVALLFLTALLFVNLGVLPAIFITSMGILQLVTAIGGAGIAWGVQKLRNTSL